MISSCAKAKAHINWFQSTSLEIDSSKKRSPEKDCEFVPIFKHFTKTRLHGGCHEADGAVRRDHVLTNVPSANKEKWIDALGRSTDKPRMEYCEDQNKTIIYIRAVQGHSCGSS